MSGKVGRCFRPGRGEAPPESPAAPLQGCPVRCEELAEVDTAELDSEEENAEGTEKVAEEKVKEFELNAMEESSKLSADSEGV